MRRASWEEAYEAALVYRCGKSARIRRSWEAWTDDEKDKYIQAVSMLEAEGHYWTFVAMHLYLADFSHPTAHFFPWHRILIWEFENALRATAPEHACLTVPVWDWARATTLRNDSGMVEAPWTLFDSFLADMGGAGADLKPDARFPGARNTDGLILSPSGSAVETLAACGYGGCATHTALTSGPLRPPFAQFDDVTQRCDFPIKFVSCSCAQQFSTRPVLRATPAFFGGKVLGATQSEITDWLLEAKSLSELRNTFAAHGDVHRSISGYNGTLPNSFGTGHMASNRSPGDPIFWGHHALVDLYWDMWTRIHTCDGKALRDIDPAAPQMCEDSLYSCEVCGNEIPLAPRASLGFFQTLLPGQDDSIDSTMFFTPTVLPQFEQLFQGELVRPPGVTSMTWGSLWTPRDVLSLAYSLDYEYDYSTIPLAAQLGLGARSGVDAPNAQLAQETERYSRGPAQPSSTLSLLGSAAGLSIVAFLVASSARRRRHRGVQLRQCALATEDTPLVALARMSASAKKSPPAEQ